MGTRQQPITNNQQAVICKTIDLAINRHSVAILLNKEKRKIYENRSSNIKNYRHALCRN